MNKNSNQAVACLIVIAFLALFTTSLSAQSVPKLKFSKPSLYSGIAGQVNAIYLFRDVTTGIDAYITIERIVNGAYLVNIDDSTLGYYDAWQPTVGGNGKYGSSYIKWDIKFADKSGKKYKFPELDATAIDIDGDNVRVREFIGVNGQSSYSVPTQIPSKLIISNTADTDNINHDPSNTNLVALGPIANSPGIDTMSENVRMNFSIQNLSEFKMYTGEEVDSNGNTGAIATNRYHCIYFHDINAVFSVLAVTYQSFTAMLNNNAVNLNWTIASEEDHFDVERSFDKESFSTAGIVLGAKSINNGAGEYSFDDKSNEISKHSIVYYRLRKVEANGDFSYSEVKAVRISSGSKAVLTVQAFPNPYMDKLNVSFSSNTQGMVDLNMLNASGVVVKKMHVTISKGVNNLQLNDLSDELPGMYVINVISNGTSIGSQKIIKN